MRIRLQHIARLALAPALLGTASLTADVAHAQVAPHATPPHWQPTGSGPNNGGEWQWELDHALNTASARDMGYEAGRPNPTIYDIDGIDNPASTVSALHALGDHAVCYIEVGSVGNYYSAAAEGIPTTYFAQLKAAGVLGRKMAGYPEYYLDINAASTVSIIESMIQKQCADKGFDAVEPDIDDSYTDNTGFAISQAQNVVFNRSLANSTHGLGLAWGQKNGDQDASFSTALQPASDFLLTEECNRYRSCSIVTPPYVTAGKLVLNAEYTQDGETTAKFCSADLSHGIAGTLFSDALSGRPRKTCA